MSVTLNGYGSDGYGTIESYSVPIDYPIISTEIYQSGSAPSWAAVVLGRVNQRNVVWHYSKASARRALRRTMIAYRWQQLKTFVKLARVPLFLLLTVGVIGVVVWYIMKRRQHGNLHRPVVGEQD